MTAPIIRRPVDHDAPPRRLPGEVAGIRERPILFSAAMVRAILDGAKTQTRRIIKPSWSRCLDLDDDDDRARAVEQCPYGQPGDRLWVREKHRVTGWDEGGHVRVEYAADGAERRVATRMDDYDDWVYRRCEIWERAGAKADVESGLMAPPPGGIPWTPSIHMPRWASRLTLEVTSVRVERLQDITDAGAVSEGITAEGYRWGRNETGVEHNAPSHAFHSLWNAINGPGSWDANPWVWVVGFRRVEP